MSNKTRDKVSVPDFIIIGAMKCGTTTLYRQLLDHPEIGLSRDKETDYFIAEKNFSKGPSWYAAQFAPGKGIYGEASPNYTKRDDFKGVPERIKAACPQVKLIYIVRDPVDRFVSQYRHSWTIGDISMSPAALPESSEYRHILDTSRYAHQLAAYLEHFPREQILILDFDRLVRQPESVLGEILDFVGAGAFTPKQSAFNENAEISRVPAPLLRFAQSPLGRKFTHILSREMRDRIRRLLARGKARQPEKFPEAVLARIAADLKADAKEFRRLSGLDFASWKV